MSTDSTFLDLEESAPLVRVWFGDAPLDLPEGRNLAAALLAAGHDILRETPVSGAPRGPYCMMGACFDCLVEIDGETRQACMIEVREGLRIARPHGSEAWHVRD